MKSSTLKRIYATPLRYPYFDADALRAIEPIDLRYRLSTLEVTDKIAEEYGIPLDRPPEMILAQFQAGRHIAQKLDNFGTALDAAEASGIDNTMLSNYIHGKRPFGPSAAVITPFAYNVMGESCHKLMFGIEGSVVLPKIYSEIARALETIPSAEKEVLHRKAKLQYALYEKQNPQQIRNAPHREVSALIGERILELIYDKGSQSYQLLGPETPYGVRNFLKQFVNEDFKHESPRLSLLMYISFETGLALDYFIAEDFTRMVPCFYQSGEELHELKDRIALDIIGICCSLPVETRTKLIGEVIGAGLGAEFIN